MLRLIPTDFSSALDRSGTVSAIVIRPILSMTAMCSNPFGTSGFCFAIQYPHYEIKPQVRAKISNKNA
jgi:hypothetical protein